MFVHMNADRTELVTAMSSDTVSTFKQKLLESLSIRKDVRASLSFGGRLLQDESELKDYQVRDYSTLQLTIHSK